MGNFFQRKSFERKANLKNHFIACLFAKFFFYSVFLKNKIKARRFFLHEFRIKGNDVSPLDFNVVYGKEEISRIVRYGVKLVQNTIK